MRKSGIVISSSDLAALLEQTRQDTIKEMLSKLNNLATGTYRLEIAGNEKKTIVLLQDVTQIIEKELNK